MPSNLASQVQRFIEREDLFSRHDRLLVACSGGLDSTVLAHLLHALGYDFAIAHMNFQLRGEASDGDAAFVEELARTLDAKFYGKAVDVKREAKAGESTQMTARRLRYDWFEEINLRGSRTRLLTAHHAGDNLETALINLIRGTGLAGLAGIAPAGFRACRPLLNCTKDQLAAYAAANDLTWREDASNQSDDYLRNRVRHHLGPLLRELGMTERGWTKTSAHLRSALVLYQDRLAEIGQRHTRLRNGVFIVERHEELSDEILSAYLHEHVREEFSFTTDQIRQLLTLPGRRTLESPTATVYVEPGRLGFIRKEDVDASPLEARRVILYPSSSSTGYVRFTVDEVERPDSLQKDGVLYLAPQSLPLHLRPRKKGDRFQPLGMNGKSKKLKDYFIDEKVPVWLRDRIYLLVNDADEIMAIPGYCISEQFKVRPGDDTVLRIATRD